MTQFSTPQLVNDHTANLQGTREQEYVTFDELTIHGSCWYIFVESIELNYAQGYGATEGFEHDINVAPMRRQTRLDSYASRHVMNTENTTDAEHAKCP